MPPMPDLSPASATFVLQGFAAGSESYCNGNDDHEEEDEAIACHKPAGPAPTNFSIQSLQPLAADRKTGPNADQPMRKAAPSRQGSRAVATFLFERRSN